MSSKYSHQRHGILDTFLLKISTSNFQDVFLLVNQDDSWCQWWPCPLSFLSGTLNILQLTPSRTAEVRMISLRSRYKIVTKFGSHHLGTLRSCYDNEAVETGWVCWYITLWWANVKVWQSIFSCYHTKKHDRGTFAGYFKLRVIFNRGLPRCKKQHNSVEVSVSKMFLWFVQMSASVFL